MNYILNDKPEVAKKGADDNCWRYPYEASDATVTAYA